MYKHIFLLAVLLGWPVHVECEELVTSLADAITQLNTHNPDLANFSDRVLTSSYLRSAAERLPNPEMEFSVEEFGGTKNGFEESEASVAITQPLELGGKRNARIAVAEVVAALEIIDAHLLCVSTRFDLEKRFVEVQRAWSDQKVIHEQVSRSRRIVDTLERKQKVGAILPLDVSKAQLIALNVELLATRAASEYENAKRALAVLWGGEPSDVGELPEVALSKDRIVALRNATMSGSLYSRRLQLERMLAAKEFQRERANAVPDVHVGFGVTRLEESNDSTFLSTVRFELPLFNRNQDTIARAKRVVELRRVDAMKQQRELSAELVSKIQQLTVLYAHYLQLRDTVLPAAQDSFDQSSKAYLAGRVSALALSDAQQILIETARKKVELLHDTQLGVLDVERMIAKGCENQGDSK